MCTLTCRLLLQETKHDDNPKATALKHKRPETGNTESRRGT
jgi:hypothetical protein